VDTRTDVYALGVVLYELLTGRLPFEAANELNLMKSILADPGVPATRYRPDLPRVLQSILATALAKERKDRYPDCRALQADLERFVLTTGQPVGAYQIAQLVERVVDGQVSASPSPTPATVPLGGEGADDATRLMAGRARRAVSEPPERPVMPTDRRTGPDDPTVKVAPRSHQRLIPVLLAAGGVLLVSGIGYVLFGSGPAQPPAATAAPTGGTPTAPPGSASGAPAPALVAAPAGTASAGDAPSGDPAGIAAEGKAAGSASEGSAPGTASGDPAGATAEGTAAGSGSEEDAEDSAPDEAAAAEGDGAGTDSGEDAAGTPAGQGAAPSAGASTAQGKPRGTMGSVEFRIRPYAVVYLDGKKVGETPFAAIEVPAGTYTVTAVNRTLNKKVSRSFEVKAGEANVFRLNLLDK
jgi:serine/threonine-protein kinase